MKFAALFLLIAMSAHAVEIVAHRGFSARAPENTLAAFELGWKNQTDACELDVYLTVDGKTVVIHDKDTKRTAGVNLDVAKSTQAELTAIDVGTWKGKEWAKEKIPTLEQALATMPKGKQRFFIEIKCGAEIVPELKRILEPMKERAGHHCVQAGCGGGIEEGDALDQGLPAGGRKDEGEEADGSDAAHCGYEGGQAGWAGSGDE
jgi:glycerophosphoryl diester phosphodiesterase